MIIKEVFGENILKYSSLELTKLPAEGLISISGKNESGKTSIGEMICFGLFGRTFTLNKDEIHKLIKWGRSSCSVTIVFTVKDDDIYRVVRRLDVDAEQGAQLFREGQGSPITTGGDAVTAAISEITGFHFEEYIESFYLAQRELQTPSSDADTIKVMAGISALAKIDEELKQTLRSERKRVVDTEEKIWGIDKKIEELGYDEQRLSTLEEMKSRCRQETNTLQNFLDRCRQAVDIYRLLYAKVKRYKKIKLIALSFSIISLVFSVEFLLAWWLIHHPRRLGAVGDALVRFSRMIAGRSDTIFSVGLGLLIGAFVGIGLFYWIVFLVRKRKRLSTDLNELFTSFGRDEQHQLETVIDEAASLVHEKADDSDDDSQSEDEEKKEEVEKTEEVEQPEVGADAEQNAATAGRRRERREIVALVDSFSIEPNELSDALGGEINDVELLGENGSLQVARLEQECEQERQLIEMIDGYRSEIADEQEKLTEMLHQIEVLEQGIELLQNGMTHMSRRFNSDVLAYTTKAIPLFTNGHYEHLKIDDDMGVRIFSSEKHDFMDFGELSSGTQRQILLALRLAMSQKLIQTAATFNQFIFFDEPFAFFDRDRIHSSLNSLPEISETISQIWIVAQELDKDAKVDIDIRCLAESDILKMDCGS